MRAVAVDVVRLGRDGHLHRHVLRLLLDEDGLAFERLRRQPAAVAHREIQLRVPQHERRQAHDQVVLAHHAQEHQPPEGRRCHRPHLQVLVEPQVDRGDGRRGDPEGQRRQPVDPLAAGIERRVDPVVDDVVVRQVVLVVEAPALLQLPGRRVGGDVHAFLAIEERDVLGVVARQRVGERVVALRVHLRDHVVAVGQQRPRVAAHVAEVQRVGLPHHLVEDRLGAAQVAIVDVAGAQRVPRDAVVEHARVEADERPVELGVERVRPGEDAQLDALGGHRRREPHHAAPAQHQSRDAPRRPRDEGLARRHLEPEVGRLDRQVADPVLGRRVERQLVEPVDRRELLLIDNPPDVADVAAHELDVDPPRRQAALPPQLGEDLDHHAESLAGQRPFERHPVAIAQGHGRRARLVHLLGQLPRRVLPLGRREQRLIRGGRPGGQRGLDRGGPACGRTGAGRISSPASRAPTSAGTRAMVICEKSRSFPGYHLLHHRLQPVRNGASPEASFPGRDGPAGGP